MRATRIHAGAAAATVLSTTAREVPDWALRYFGGWWNAALASLPPTLSATADTGPLIVAETDSRRLNDIEALATGHEHTEVDYANARTLVAHGDDGTVSAVQPAERLAYQYTPHECTLVIAGDPADPVALAVAASRLGRELVRAQLLADGWTVLHASAVVRNGQALLALGGKGSGKTTSALLLARRGGFDLLANDRVFIRPENGALRVLPWPSAAAVGFGLLESTGLYVRVRERVLDGEQMHPTQHQRVTNALRAGSTKPIWNAKGKELKPQFFPDQLTSILGLELATEAHAAALLFPRIRKDAEPHPADAPRTLGKEDFFTCRTEDRYPDIFRLTSTAGGPAPELADQLAQLPRRGLVLNHDCDASGALLAKTAEEMTDAR